MKNKNKNSKKSFIFGIMIGSAIVMSVYVYKKNKEKTNTEDANNSEESEENKKSIVDKAKDKIEEKANKVADFLVENETKISAITTGISFVTACFALKNQAISKTNKNKNSMVIMDRDQFDSYIKKKLNDNYDSVYCDCLDNVLNEALNNDKVVYTNKRIGKRVVLTAEDVS